MEQPARDRHTLRSLVVLSIFVASVITFMVFQLYSDHPSQLTWLLVYAAAIMVVVTAALIARQADVLSTLRNPLVAGAAAAFFVFLTLDRVREMNVRIEGVATKAEDAAVRKVDELVSGVEKSAKARMDSLMARIAEIRSNNPWLEDVDPSGLALDTKHLEPINRTVEALIAGREPEKARRLLTYVLSDTTVKGTANDYHNLGVAISRDLDDDLLAIRCYEIYLSKTDLPDADVLADVLSLYVRSGQLSTAARKAKALEFHLNEGQTQFTGRWRPWVFLSDYYMILGRNDDAIELLKRAEGLVANPDELPHIKRQLAEIYKSLGRSKDAEREFTECLAQFPAFAPAAGQLANMYWQLGRSRDAEMLLERTVRLGILNPELDKAYGDLHAKLANLKFGRGDISGAKEHAVQAYAYGVGSRCAEVLTLLALDHDLGAGRIAP